MREYRLTFTTENFGAISQALVDMGVSFRVEPMEAPGLTAPSEVPAKPRAPAKKPAKAAPKKKAAGSAPKPSQPSLAGAQRVLERLARSESDAGASRAEKSETASEPPTEPGSGLEERDETSA
jgi:hypothetical protein